MMKKLVSLLVTVTMLFTGVGGVFAASTPYSKVKSFYKSYIKSGIEDDDDILAAESLGIETDSKKIIDGAFSTYSAGGIAKAVITIILHGDDPRNYNGVNYVEQLENAVEDNGAVTLFSGSDVYSSDQVFPVYALYVAGSSKTALAASYLASTQKEDGAFTCTGYEYDDSWNLTGTYEQEDVDSTGWAIEALSLVSKTKYKTNISNAIAYLKTQQQDDGGYAGSYGVNTDTQACVLMGLITYNASGVKGKTYNSTAGNNPYKNLLTYQNDDGSFYYPGTGDYYGPGNFNTLATQQAAQAVGYYYNGNVYKKAEDEYEALKLLDKKAYTPTVKNIKTRSIKVSYKKTSKAVGYKIKYRIKGTKTYKCVKTTKTSYVLKKLKKGKTYQIKVKAYIRTSQGTKAWTSYSKIKTVKVKK